MSEKPILFSGPMVRAILEGRKTQTRRVMKPQPDHCHRNIIGKTEPYKREDWDCLLPQLGEKQIQPRYAVGDILWVREAWSDASGSNGQKCALYRATYKGHSGIVWRPSIHMPRWACRLRLEVTAVRCQRLQEISAADAVAESCDSCTPYDQYRALWEFINGPGSWAANPWVWVYEFRRLA